MAGYTCAWCQQIWATVNVSSVKCNACSSKHQIDWAAQQMDHLGVMCGCHPKNACCVLELLSAVASLTPGGQLVAAPTQVSPGVPAQWVDYLPPTVKCPIHWTQVSVKESSPDKITLFCCTIRRAVAPQLFEMLKARIEAIAK